MREQEIAAGDRAGDEESAGFDAVGNDGVRGAVKFFDALHADGGRAGAFDLRAHFGEQRGEIGEFRARARNFREWFRLRRAPRR